MANRPAGPVRVGVTRGNPTEERKQDQVNRVNAVPVQKTVGGKSLTFSLGRQLVEVDFGTGYVANTSQAVVVSLPYVPKYVERSVRRGPPAPSAGEHLV